MPGGDFAAGLFCVRFSWYSGAIARMSRAVSALAEPPPPLRSRRTPFPRVCRGSHTDPPDHSDRSTGAWLLCKPPGGDSAMVICCSGRRALLLLVARGLRVTVDADIATGRSVPADWFTVSADGRISHLHTQRNDRDGTVVKDESYRARLRLGTTLRFSDVLTAKVRTAGRFSNDQESFEFVLRDHVPTVRWSELRPGHRRRSVSELSLLLSRQRQVGPLPVEICARGSPG